MNKFMVIVLMFIVGVFALIKVLPETPVIVLPESAHHNTFGELPVVEVWDDGDFYEEDGAEDRWEENGAEDRWGVTTICPKPERMYAMTRMFTFYEDSGY